MILHRNAKLGLSGRFALVRAIEGGMSVEAAAAAFSVSPATAHRWWRRWRDAGAEARQTLDCLCDRSSRPHRFPRELPAELQERICVCRLKTGWGPRLVAGATGFAHSTVWKVLRRAGVSRRPRAPREDGNRYEWPCAGDLLHMDVSRHARFERAMRSPVTAHSSRVAGSAARPGSATTTPTRSSTTTRGWPTSNSTLTRRPRPSRASSGAHSPTSRRTGSRPGG
jgi:transposase